MYVDKVLEVPATEEAPSGNETVPVRAAAFDAYRVCGPSLVDCCFPLSNYWRSIGIFGPLPPDRRAKATVPQVQRATSNFRAGAHRIGTDQSL